MKLPGPEHPILIEACAERIRVLVGGHAIADSRSAVRMLEADHPPVLYLPRTDVDMSRLSGTSQTTHCPFKGDANYFEVTGAGATREAVAWSYEQPYPAMEAIRGHLAFYPDRVDAIHVGD